MSRAAVLALLGIVVLGAVGLILRWSDAPDPAHNVILISIDTLRADHLGAYGYHRRTSPQLDAFAREGIVFERMVNTGGGTLPVHVSMLTSLPPLVHDVWTHNRRRLDEERVTLAELLRARGYRTAAFVDGGWMSAKFGFDQGFETYDDRGGGFAAILPKVRAWLEEHRSERFFLFVHTYDVHSAYRKLPYDPPAPYKRLYARDYTGTFTGCRVDLCASKLLERINQQLQAGELSPDAVFEPEDLEYIIALYDGGIRYVDDELGRFFDFLRKLDLWEESLLIVTSDHGEEFLEHDRLLHDQAYEETARVPFLMKLPGPGLRGRRVETLVSTLDVMPTVLDVVGIPGSSEIHGTSLLSFARGEAREDARVFIAAEKPKLRTPRWSFLLRLDRAHELYDLDADPGERTNVTSQHPELGRRFADELEKTRAAQQQLRIALTNRAELTPEELEALKALGYLN
jgi:arylsulfatase A-like enzyme